MIKAAPALIISFVGLVNLTSYLTPAQAEIIPTIKIAADPPEPSPNGNPDGRKPTGTRGPCENTNTPFTPLLPVTNSGFSGYTLTGHPTFWFYVPYKTGSVSSGKFVLEDREGNTFYRTSFTLPSKPGFVSISIPNTAKQLVSNEQYTWVLKLDCASTDSGQPNFVIHRGLVEKVDMPNLETELKTARLEERINLYVKNNIWYDVSSDLAQIHSRPQAWRDLLKAIGLEQLEQEPIAGAVLPLEK
jgi:hypothetical protein